MTYFFVLIGNFAYIFRIKAQKRAKFEEKSRN